MIAVIIKRNFSLTTRAMSNYATYINKQNIFAELMEAAKVCSLGQISGALYAVGGQYRRNM
jgi:isobutyryl-CoA mutase